MPLPELRLDHVVIASSDFSVSDEFYREVLGADVRVPHPSFRLYRIGDRQLNVHPAAPPPEARVARLAVRPGNSDLCFEWIGSLDEAARHLRSHGVEPEAEDVPTVGARGPGRSIYFRDPDGSLLELITYPAGVAR